jgi:outer membrane protein assembly factor BamD
MKKWNIFAAMFRKATFLVLAAIAVLLTSCSRYQRLVKSGDNELKYKKAVEYYENEDYYRAMQLFDQLIPVFRGTDKAESIYYMYANAYYKQQDYILASHYFQRFTANFPRSEKAEECAFMSAYCLYLDSPRYSLDQTSTLEAVKELQLFIDQYPNSSRLQECNELIDKLREKLEKKYYEIAKLYYKMSSYKSAVTSFDNLINDFPDTDYREESMFLILKANYKYALNSVAEKRKERFTEAMKKYNDFASLYPESLYMKEARNIYEDIKTQISQ